MGNRRLGRRRLESVLKRLNAQEQDDSGSRSGLQGFHMPAFELAPAKYTGLFDDFHAISGGTGTAVDGDMAGTHGGQVWLADVGGSNDAITLVKEETGGVVEIHTGDTDNDTTTLTAPNSTFALDAASARKIWFECRIKANDITDLSIFVGLASNDGAVVTDGAGANWTDSVGFYISEGAASQDIQLLSAVGDTETNTSLSTDLGNAYVILSWYFDGTNVHAYVNGTIVFPTISASTRDNGGGDNLFCDYVRVCMER
jgi:hypothetical protein